jgi:nucleotide-binding universal stress UspA family protein
MRVLFATDGSDHSARARDLLARLAHPERTEVVAMSVNGFETAMRKAQREGHFSTEEAHAAAQAAADGACEALRDAGLSHVEVRVEDGDEATEIVHAADTEDFGLVVVGAGNEGWLDTVVLGSVSGSVVHGTSCPVLVVHRVTEDERARRVVVGADGSEGSHHAISAFAGLADPERVEVTVVPAAPPRALPPGGPAGGELAAAEVDDEELRSGNRHADEAATTLRDAGFRVETEGVAGSPATVLLEQVVRREADIVVVGARGLGRFRAKVLGSVSDRVMRHAPATLVGR